MEKTFKVFHYISFLQYPNLVLALYYCYRPLFTQFENIVEDYGNGLLFLGIGLSFTSLADLSKRTKITDYVFGKRKNARRWIIYMCSLLVIIFGFAVFLHFFVNKEGFKGLSTGIFVLGIGMIGLLRMNLEMIRNYQKDWD